MAKLLSARSSLTVRIWLSGDDLAVSTVILCQTIITDLRRLFSIMLDIRLRSQARCRFQHGVSSRSRRGLSSACTALTIIRWYMLWPPGWQCQWPVCSSLELPRLEIPLVDDRACPKWRLVRY